MYILTNYKKLSPKPANRLHADVAAFQLKTCSIFYIKNLLQKTDKYSIICFICQTTLLPLTQ
jgi:hypothetical protein